MAEISFSYRGIKAGDVGLQVQDISRNILPPAIPRTIAIPNRTGNVFHRSDFGMNEIIMDVFIVGSDISNAQSIQRDVANFLNPALGLGDLIIDDETDKKYEAVISGNTNIRQILELKRGTITFLVPDAVAFSTIETTEDWASVNISRSGKAFQENTFPPTSLEEQQFVNEPRFEVANVDGSNLGDGILVEEGTTNLYTLSDSKNPTDANFSGVNGADDFEDTNVFIVGTQSLRWEFNGTANGALVAPRIAATAGNPITGSVYVIADSGSEGESLQIRIFFYTSGGSFNGSVTSTFTTSLDWQQVRVSTSSLPTGTAEVEFRIQDTTGRILTFWTDAFQMEELDHATSWHEGGSTRNNEVCTINVKENGTDGRQILNGTEGTISFLFRPKVRNQNTAISVFEEIGAADLLHSVGGGEEILLQITGNDDITFLISDGTSSQITVDIGQEIRPDRTYFVSIRWFLTGSATDGFIKLDTFDITFANQAGTSASTSVSPLTLSGITNLNIGHSSSQTFYANTRFRNLFISDTALSDSKIQSLIDALPNDFTDSAWKMSEDQTGIWKFDERITRGFFSLGTEKQLPILEYTFNEATTSPLTIENVTEGKKVVINRSFVSGDILIIDNEQNLVTLNGTNILSDVDITSDFFKLQAQKEQIFQFEEDSTSREIETDFQSAKYKYTKRFL